MRVLKAAVVVLVIGLALGLYLTRSPRNQSRVEAPLLAVEAVGLTVSDLGRSVEFYSKVLFFEQVAVREAEAPAGEARVARMRLGDEFIELTERPGLPATDRALRRIVIVVSDIDQVGLWLRRHKVERLQPASGRPAGGRSGIRAISFADPDGHPLEARQFPPGAGHPRWHFRRDSVFLGIDHTELVSWRDPDGDAVLVRSKAGPGA